ncbi:hypothetical protein GCM10027052_06110 [Parafrigoribacterium mesophilum]|uniref:DUF222 domain-containing protein n=1 Tax=Parafrigoribacterium mesophilum TaxID=433646 RepID=UPI0031FDF0D5
MSSSESVFDTAIASVTAAVEQLPSELAPVKALDDSALLDAQRRLASARTKLDACASMLAGETGYRSRHDLGLTGLAQREGFRTPEALVQHTTGGSARQATTLVTVGTMIRDAITSQSSDDSSGDGADDTYAVHEPWLTAVGTAVNTGLLSAEAARAIRTGLGQPTGDAPSDAETSGVTPEMLADAAARLLQESGKLNVDELLKRARELRDELDEEGIAARETAIYEQRSFRRVKRSNGVSRFILDPDLETGAYLDDLYDKMTSPRRGGPRFIDPADQAWAEAVANDERSLDQYVHDSITALLRLGVNADLRDTRTIVGPRIPAVRVLTTAGDITSITTGTGTATGISTGPVGHGRIEGCGVPVSLETVQRIACTGGTIPILFDDNGQVLDLGREQRLFTPAQKIAISARDGGCMWTGCDSPPGATETHHIDQWDRDHGNTDVALGILLCRHHHLLLHNNHWNIILRDGSYWLIPPPDIDPAQTPRPLASKSAALADLQRQLTDLQRQTGPVTTG